MDISTSLTIGRQKTDSLGGGWGTEPPPVSGTAPRWRYGLQDSLLPVKSVEAGKAGAEGDCGSRQAGAERMREGYLPGCGHDRAEPADAEETIAAGMTALW